MLAHCTMVLDKFTRTISLITAQRIRWSNLRRKYTIAQSMKLMITIIKSAPFLPIKSLTGTWDHTLNSHGSYELGTRRGVSQGINLDYAIFLWRASDRWFYCMCVACKNDGNPWVAPLDMDVAFESKNATIKKTYSSNSAGEIKKSRRRE